MTTERPALLVSSLIHDVRVTDGGWLQ